MLCVELRNLNVAILIFYRGKKLKSATVADLLIYTVLL
jgi:hypothetical protein